MTKAMTKSDEINTVVSFEKFSDEQKQLLKDTVCKGATDDELKMFSHVCEKRGLDPFTKQIHAVKRWDSKLRREVMSIQTGIDGLRLIADRTGKYRGQGDPEWCTNDGVWIDIWLSKDNPSAARVYVHREGFDKPLVGIARWTAYVQTTKDGVPNMFWRKMGPEQLAKCAEALALRKAFPQELSGLYTNDEMQQADNQITQSVSAVDEEAETKHAQRKELKKQRGELNQGLLECSNISSIKDFCKEFHDKHKLVWKTETGHKADETFKSLADEHKGRIDDIIGFINEVDSCDNAKGFLELEKLFKTRDMFSSHQDVRTAIDNAGERLGMPGYAEQEPVPLADKKEPELDLKGSLAYLETVEALPHLANWYNQQKDVRKNWGGNDRLILSNAYEKRRKELHDAYLKEKKEQQLKTNS